MTVMTSGGHEHRIPWRLIGWGGAAGLLLVPYVANFPWTLSDYVIMGTMFAIAGGTIELAVRASDNWAHRLGAILAVLTGFLTVWVNLAVGMIGSEDNSYNLWFGGVLAVAIGGSILARSSSVGMARAMVVTALAQAFAGAFGVPADVRGGVFSLLFALPWLLAAGLFWSASRRQTSAA